MPDNNEVMDPILHQLFSDATTELEGSGFTEQVLNRTARVGYYFAAGLGGIALLLVPLIWFLATPLQGFALLVVQFMSTPLIELGSGWLSWLLAPVNTFATVFIVIAKIGRVLWRHIRHAAYVN